MITVSAFAFTGYPVTDIARARSFYEGLFSLRTATAFEHGGRHWIEYDVGDGTLAITNMAGDKWKPSADGPCLALEVADFNEAVAELQRHGVRFLVDPMDSGVCRMAVIADPDGNSLTIHQRYRHQSLLS